MPTILTFTGRTFDLLNPDPTSICIEDIAHALSLKCRWGGHTSRFYSVAEHSLNVMSRVSDKAKFEALLHDAAEAYLGDIASPFKDYLGVCGGHDLDGRAFFSPYRCQEKQIELVIQKAFNYEVKYHDEVKRADLELQGMEGAALLKVNPVPKLKWPGPNIVGCMYRADQEWWFKEWYQRLKP